MAAPVIEWTLRATHSPAIFDDGTSAAPRSSVDDVLYNLGDALGPTRRRGHREAPIDVVAHWSEDAVSLLGLMAWPASRIRCRAKLDAPLRPTRVFAAASNYVEHADEMGTVLAAKKDSNPYMFTKMSTTVVGPGDVGGHSSPESAESRLGRSSSASSSVNEGGAFPPVTTRSSTWPATPS